MHVQIFAIDLEYIHTKKVWEREALKRNEKEEIDALAFAAIF